VNEDYQVILVFSAIEFDFAMAKRQPNDSNFTAPIVNFEDMGETQSDPFSKTWKIL
jgi:hypothetical protein